MNTTEPPKSDAVSSDDSPLPDGEATRAVGGTRTEQGSSYGDFTPDRGNTVYVESVETLNTADAGGDAGAAGIAGTSADQSRAGHQKEAGNP